MLIVQRSNFQTLHWKIKGDDFDNMHANVTNGYYETVSDDIDDVAEILLRRSENPVNVITACRMVIDKAGKDVLYSTENDYTRNEVIEYCAKSLSLILTEIEESLESDEIKSNIKNVGIKSYLEALYDKYDKELYFLNRRRMN